MQAVVLAGGLGTRLRSLTESIPKVLVLVKGKPFISYLLSLLAEVDEAVLCLSYLPDPIMDFVINGDKWGIEVSYSIEKEPLGTAGALKQAEPLLKDTFLVINGDTYLPVNHRDIMERFLRSGKEGMMTVCSHPEYRNDVLVKGGLVVKNNKQNPKPDFNYVNAGVVALRKEALRFIPRKRSDLEDSLYQQLIEASSLAAYLTEQRFYDIGTFEGIRALEDYFDYHQDPFPY